jgi:hypothetical protein
MSLRRTAVMAALGGTAVVTGWLAVARFDLDLLSVAAAPMEDSFPTSVTEVGPIKAAEVTPIEAAKSDDAISRDAPIVEAALPVPVPPPETASLEVAAAATLDPAPSPAEVARIEAPDDCHLSDACIDRYLWSIYERTPKQDTIKVSERVKVTVKTKGKTRTVTKTVTKLVDEDFTWKDPKAAQKADMPLMDYVIGGMDRRFKLKLYHCLRAMDEAGLEPGITSAFRDDYRQAIASGKKAASDSSYHGGSRRGGYGHGLAADLVSVKGGTRAERWITSEILWKWVDAHGQEYGIGRPYQDRDPPHVGPIDGKEYADKRGRRAKAKVADARKPAASADHTNRSKTQSAKTASR